MEMLIVIAIVAVLISVAVPVLSSQLERSREAVDLDARAVELPLDRRGRDQSITVATRSQNVADCPDRA